MMIHGMFGGCWVWETYRKFFEGKGYTCVTPTLRYHDTTPDDPPHPNLGTTSLLDYINDLEMEIGKLDTPPIIMGHSMGGLLTQILGSRGLAQALVLLAPAAPHGITALKYTVIRSIASQLTNYGFWRNPIKPVFKNTVYSSLHLLSPDQQKKVFSRFVCESGRAVWEIGLAFLDKHKASEVDESKVTCPVLVISGVEDRITPASVVKKIAAKYNSVSTYKEFEGHAHWIVGEPGWEDVARHTADWLDLKC